MAKGFSPGVISPIRLTSIYIYVEVSYRRWVGLDDFFKLFDGLKNPKIDFVASVPQTFISSDCSIADGLIALGMLKMDYNGMLKNGLQWNAKKWITMEC